MEKDTYLATGCHPSKKLYNNFPWIMYFVTAYDEIIMDQKK